MNAAQDASGTASRPRSCTICGAIRTRSTTWPTSAEHRETLARLRGANHEHLLATRDVGFLPEGEIHERSQGTTPYDMGKEESKYPLERILATAELATSLHPADTAALVKAFEDADSAVRYWAAQGLLMRDRAGVQAGHGSLMSALADPSPYVRVTAAEALGRFGEPADEALALRVLRDHADANRHGVFVAIAALNSVAQLGPHAEAIRAGLRAERSARHRIRDTVSMLGGC